ncbi:hypothetical protein A2U01_0074780, partial [Trifolium medium]|nr:hypothetical protein [Trifolium medium]
TKPSCATRNAPTALRDAQLPEDILLLPDFAGASRQLSCATRKSQKTPAACAMTRRNAPETPAQRAGPRTLFYQQNFFSLQVS